MILYVRIRMVVCCLEKLWKLTSVYSSTDLQAQTMKLQPQNTSVHILLAL